jgi:hypothetical protein
MTRSAFGLRPGPVSALRDRMSFVAITDFVPSKILARRAYSVTFQIEPSEQTIFSIFIFFVRRLSFQP